MMSEINDIDPTINKYNFKLGIFSIILISLAGVGTLISVLLYKGIINKQLIEGIKQYCHSLISSDNTRVKDSLEKEDATPGDDKEAEHEEDISDNALTRLDQDEIESSYNEGMNTPPKRVKSKYSKDDFETGRLLTEEFTHLQGIFISKEKRKSQPIQPVQPVQPEVGFTPISKTKRLTSEELEKKRLTLSEEEYKKLFEEYKKYSEADYCYIKVEINNGNTDSNLCKFFEITYDEGAKEFDIPSNYCDIANKELVETSKTFEQIQLDIFNLNHHHVARKLDFGNAQHGPSK